MRTTETPPPTTKTMFHLLVDEAKPSFKSLLHLLPHALHFDTYCLTPLSTIPQNLPWICAYSMPVLLSICSICHPTKHTPPRLTPSKPFHTTLRLIFFHDSLYCNSRHWLFCMSSKQTISINSDCLNRTTKTYGKTII